jgi:hypothetical protein
VVRHLLAFAQVQPDLLNPSGTNLKHSAQILVHLNSTRPDWLEPVVVQVCHAFFSDVSSFGILIEMVCLILRMEMVFPSCEFAHVALNSVWSKEPDHNGRTYEPLKADAHVVLGDARSGSSV